MESDAVKAMVCAARVMAIAVGIAARIEGMKAANADRQANGLANAYDAKAFFEAEEELMRTTHIEIGL